jgi:hypothetical protein
VIKLLPIETDSIPNIKNITTQLKDCSEFLNDYSSESSQTAFFLLSTSTKSRYQKWPFSCCRPHDVSISRNFFSSHSMHAPPPPPPLLLLLLLPPPPPSRNIP